MAEKQQAQHEQRPSRQRRSKTRIKAPWPDPKARQEMSEAEVASDNLGKHSKNPDWEKSW
jgi:hypothetical protein